MATYADWIANVRAWTPNVAELQTLLTARLGRAPTDMEMTEGLLNDLMEKTNAAGYMSTNWENYLRGLGGNILGKWDLNTIGRVGAGSPGFTGSYGTVGGEGAYDLLPFMRNYLVGYPGSGYPGWQTGGSTPGYGQFLTPGTGGMPGRWQSPTASLAPENLAQAYRAAGMPELAGTGNRAYNRLIDLNRTQNMVNAYQAMRQQAGTWDQYYEGMIKDAKNQYFYQPTQQPSFLQYLWQQMPTGWR